MIKIFGYELRRLLTSGLFITMLLVNAVFAWYILTTDIIEGIAYTAPFSVWSYCAYNGKLLPVSIITVMLLQAGYYGKQQKQVEILLFASPVTHSRILMIRTAALGVCFLIICLIECILCAVFFAVFFGYYGFGVFIIPTLLEIIPCFVFATGIVHIAGRVHQGLVYALLPVFFIVGFIGIKGAFDMFGGGYFSAYPLTLSVGANGEPDFVMSSSYLFARFIYLLLGAGFFFVNIVSKSKLKKNIDRMN